MAKKKRKTRKQLLKEPDEFINFSGRLIQFGTEHKTRIVLALSAIFLLLIGISTFNFFSRKAADEAFFQLKVIQQAYEEKLKKDGPEKARTDLADKFQNLLTRYPNQYGGQLARVIYANACFQGGEFDKAVELYKGALKDFNDNPFFKNMIINNLGLALIKKKDFKQARRYFEMLISDQNSIHKDQALYHIGLIHASEGEQEKSRIAFEELIAKNPESLYTDVVKEKLGQQ